MQNTSNSWSYILISIYIMSGTMNDVKKLFEFTGAIELTINEQQTELNWFCPVEKLL